MSRKRAFSCSYLICFLLAVSVIVEGAPVETTPKSEDDVSALKAKDSPVLKGTEAPNQKRDTTTPGGATREAEAFSTTFKTEASTTLKPGTPTTKGVKDLSDVTTKNPTSSNKIPFKPSPQIFGDLPSNSNVKQTTQTPNAVHAAPVPPVGGHVKIPQSSTNSHKTPSPIRITRVYRVKPQTGCSNSKKDHDVKVHIGEGRYLNIKITED